MTFSEPTPTGDARFKNHFDTLFEAFHIERDFKNQTDPETNLPVTYLNFELQLPSRNGGETLVLYGLDYVPRYRDPKLRSSGVDSNADLHDWQNGRT